MALKQKVALSTNTLQFVRDLLPMYDLDFARMRLEKEKEPYHLRKDVVLGLTRGQEAAVKRYVPFVRHDGLDKLEKTSDAVRKTAQAKDAKQLLLAIAYRNLKMVEIGWIKDKTSQGVLVSLMLTNEAETDGEYWGDTAAARKCAENMIKHLKWSGLYIGDTSVN